MRLSCLRALRLFVGSSCDALVTGHADEATALRLTEKLLRPAAPKAPEEAALPNGSTLWIVEGTNPEDGDHMHVHRVVDEL